MLRVLTGLSIVVVAFTEKLWNLPMGLAFLAEHPFNFFPAMGLSAIGDTEFTLPLLGWSELVGHLPIYGIMGLLRIWGKERPESDQALGEGVAEHAGSTGRVKAGR